MDNNQKLNSELNRLGIDPKTDGPINITFKNKETGKSKTVTLTPNGSIEELNESLSSKIVGLALLCTLAAGTMSCTKIKDSGPNNTEMSSENTETATAWIQNVKQKTYQQIPDSLLKHVGPGTEALPDSVILNSKTPWVGYWKFTDACRVNNKQALIWSQKDDNPLNGIVYNVIQLGKNSGWENSQGYKELGGVGYLVTAWSIKSFKYDAAKNTTTTTLSSPEVDSGKPLDMNIQFDGKGENLNIFNWGGGNARRVGGLSDFKW